MTIQPNQPSQMPAQRPQQNQIRPIDEVRGQLSAMESQIKAVLPPNVTVERFTRVTMTALQTNPDLLAKDRNSLFSACLNCAKDGLIPDGKEAALVPYKGKVQYIPMVRGIIKTVRNSGGVSTITPQVVCEKDRFRHWVDDQGVHLEHEPMIFGERGKLIGAYCIAKMKDSTVEIEVMSKAEIDKVRAVSQARNGPWDDWYDEMAKKTTVRRLSKRLPLSAEAEQVVQRDDELYEFDKPQGPDKGAEMTEVIRAAMAREAQAAERRSEPAMKALENLADQPEKTEADVPDKFDEYDPLANYVAPIETGTSLAGKRLGELKLDVLEARIRVMNEWHQRNQRAPAGKIAEFLARADEYVRREKAKTQVQAPAATDSASTEPAPWELEAEAVKIGG